MNSVFQIALYSLIAGQTTPVFLGTTVIPGEEKDLSKPAKSSVNSDRLGGFGSDFWFDPNTGNMFGLVDRGPGGGTISYETRVQRFKPMFEKNTGKLQSFKLQETLKLKNGNQSYDGLNPFRKTGKADNQGLSMDPEGIVRGPNGTFFISEEYGPLIAEFKIAGSGTTRVLQKIRTFKNPNNLVPRDQNGGINFVSPIENQPPLISGRQDNRGFEGLAITPDGRFLFGLLQGSLQEEGNPDGKYSQNLRLIRYDIATGKADRQYIYPLESISEINSRIATEQFTEKQQGRTIGISAILALSHREFLVLERENRGIGVDDPLAKKPVASKRIYKISLQEATDVSDISLKGSNALPDGVTPVSKTLWMDLASELSKAKQPIGEKIEALAIGPKLSGSNYAFVVATDNDFSVTQGEKENQLDVLIGGGTTEKVPLDTRIKGKALIPSYIYSFRVNLPEYIPPFWFKATK